MRRWINCPCCTIVYFLNINNHIFYLSFTNISLILISRVGNDLCIEKKYITTRGLKFSRHLIESGIILIINLGLFQK